MTAMTSSLESSLPRVLPSCPVACNHLVMEEKRCRCLLESGSGVARDDGNLLRLPILSSSSELSISWSFLLLLFALLPFAKHNLARAIPIALRQHARGSKFLHRLQRSRSIGAAKLMGHVCDRACLAVC